MQVGCILVDVLVVQHDESIPELAKLVSGGGHSYEVAQAVYQKTQTGEIKLATSCVPVRALSWRVNLSVPENHFAAYQIGGRDANKLERRDVNRLGRSSVAAPVFPKASGKGQLMSAYEIEVCGRGGIQLPWAYITQDSYMILCPYPEHREQPAALKYPRRDEDPKAGIHLTTPFWRHASNNWQPETQPAWEYVRLIIVVDERGQRIS